MLASFLRSSLAIALAFLVVPAGASALTVSADATAITITGDGADDRPLIELDGVQLKISDVFAAGGVVTPGSGCSQAGLQPYEVHCPLRAVINASLGAGGDEVDLRTTSLTALTVDGGEGNDAIATNDPVNPETLTTTLTFSGGPGNDIVSGWAGADALDGGSGDDSLNGAAGADQLTGGEDRDVLRGGAGGDTLRGGSGDDQLFGDDGGDSLAGEAGNDDVVGNAGSDTVDGGDGDDRLEEDTGIAGVATGRGAGTDALRGGAGRDSVSYSEHGAVTVTLDSYANDGAPGEGDNLGSDIESVTGSPSADTLTGDESPNTFLGGDGDDTIDGRGGADVLSGGAGADVVTGGAGRDTLAGDDPQSSSCFGSVTQTFNCVGGSDELRARDGEVDAVACGFEADVAQVDAADEITAILPFNVCETIDRPAGSGGPGAAGPGPGSGTAPRLAVTLLAAPKTGRALASKHLRVRVRCTRACTISAKLALGKVVYATGTARLRRAGTATVTLKVAAKRRRAVQRLKRKSLGVTVTRTEAGKRLVGAATLRLR